MDENTIVEKAIEKTKESINAYCKFLSANDSGETGGHQAGILISIKALSMLFNKQINELDHIEKRTVKINWQNDITTESNFIYYTSKHELRITGFGYGFPYLKKEYTGALFILTKQDKENYSAFILNTEEEISEYLNAVGISTTETNNIIKKAGYYKSIQEMELIQKYIEELKKDGIEFPDSYTMSKVAREIENSVYNCKNYTITYPDKKLISYTDEEYRLFRKIEYDVYSTRINQGFNNMDSFIDLANKIINRRKSRAGKSLEHHIAAIFDDNNLRYEEQVITEGNKRPDFIFPSGEAYHNLRYPTDKIVSLASKTTCKDRWRQVINEADRLRDKNKYLLTLQQGISSAQLSEMEQEKVILVVPDVYKNMYPANYRDKIWNVKKFIDYIKEIEA